MTFFFPTCKNATAYLSLTLFSSIAVSNFSPFSLSTFPCTRDDRQKPPFQHKMSLIDCFYSGHVFYAEILKKSVKKIESSKVDKVYVTRCSNSRFFFSVGILFKHISDETRSVTEEMIAPWLATTLPPILSRYPFPDIFNADESGLFYQCVPNKT